MLKILEYIFETAFSILLNILITWVFIWIISLCFDFQCTLKLVCGVYVTTCLLKFRLFTNTNTERK